MSCAAVNDVLSWIALAVALLADSGSGWLEVAKLVGGAVGLVLVLPALAASPTAGRRPGAVASVVLDPRRRLGPRCRGIRDRDGPALRLRRVCLRRPRLAPVARAARRGAVRVAAWSASLLLPLYLVLPGATTDFRELDLRAGGEILVVLVVAAGSKLIAGGFSAAPPASPATTRSRSASC